MARSRRQNRAASDDAAERLGDSVKGMSGHHEARDLAVMMA
jgi:hypothetical protein